MPDEARDGRNVALNLTSVHGVLDCPKKNQAIIVGSCIYIGQCPDSQTNVDFTMPLMVLPPTTKNKI